MSITPGEEPRARDEEPMLAEEPLPPGNGDIEAKVEDLDQKLRASGSDEAAEAQDTKEKPDETSEDEPEDVS
ncbi:hypothetical protein SGUI_2494 [Serinicoccus hydrothermalis]|uniref:Uncharacterized protein n=1 Tax=Serinicoccus hydrothermalis TaxID=1758689 RepID=A0A1B1NEM2_9MICO|nr:hypothetical protein [Serinicoccus hydrothermalis]ANS79890.1 hypothetical protein SGUI_2494 [Serinicoccus hydrothermalis]